MDAMLHQIEGCTRENDVSLTAFDNIVYGPGEAMASRMAVEEPGWTPYCLDVERREMLFVELPPKTDLSQVLRPVPWRRRVAVDSVKFE